MSARPLTSTASAIADDSRSGSSALEARFPDTPLVSTRKAEHIRINLEEDVGAKGVNSGFGHYRFVHHALPEIDLEEVTVATSLLGKSLTAPILISCMTGGTPKAQSINTNLACAAAELGLPMGLGSGRALLERPETLPTFAVRSHAPEIPLLANLGAVQLARDVSVEDCRRLVDILDADALVLHLNPLQEALQPEGDTCFGGLLGRIGEVCRRLERPVIVKEVGWGLAPDVVRALFSVGVTGIDVAGAGGTSWSEVERHRLQDPVRNRVAAAFAAWGLSTAEAVRDARLAAPDGLVFASGGVRDGIDVAKAIALGADMAGLAGPFLHAAHAGVDRAVELGSELILTLRLAMFCLGARSLSDLRGTPRMVANGGRVYSETLRYATRGPGQFLDITDDVRRLAARSGVRDGQVQVFSVHTTAAIRINENEPGLMADFRRLLDRVVPNDDDEQDNPSRRATLPRDEPINDHAHCAQLLLSSSESIPIVGGSMQLGTGQRIFLIELCSSRSREIAVQVLV